MKRPIVAGHVWVCLFLNPILVSPTGAQDLTTPLGEGAARHMPTEVPLGGLVEDLARFEGLDNLARGDSLLELFRERGFEPVVQTFPNRHPDWEPRSEGRNLMVTIGSGSREIILGAHYDAAPLGNGLYTGGVVDNGAAAVILTRVVESLRAHELQHRVRVVLFDLEEFGLLGSEAFVSEVDLQQLSAMVNVDIAAYGTTLVYGPASHDGNEVPYLALRTVCVIHQIPCVESPGYPVSDDRSFQSAGIPNISLAILERIEAHQFWLMLNAEPDSGLREGVMPKVGQVIHTAEDRLELAEPAAMTRMHDVLVALVLELDRLLGSD